MLCRRPLRICGQARSSTGDTEIYSLSTASKLKADLSLRSSTTACAHSAGALLPRFAKVIGKIPTQIEEKTPGSVKNLKKEAASVAEKVAEKVEKVATPVAEAVAPKRVSFCKQNSKASQYVANDDSANQAHQANIVCFGLELTFGQAEAAHTR